MQGSFVLVGLTILAAVFVQASAHADHGSEPHYTKTGEHNAEHDQEAILGSREAVGEFAKLSPEESLTKLGEIITKIDTNNDMFVSDVELTAWIMKSFISMDIEETEKIFPEYDANKNGKITWAEYIDKMKRDVNDTTTESFKTDMKQDKQKFDAADADQDGGLTLMEFTTFWYPYDFESMHHVEIDLTMQQLDKNKDGKLDLKEYAGEGDDSAEEANGDQFAKYDTDHDGLLDREEVRPWIVPSTEPEALSEAVHLIKETDSDNDGRLSRDEILSKIEMWGGSSVTGAREHEEL